MSHAPACTAEEALERLKAGNARFVGGQGHFPSLVPLAPAAGVVQVNAGPAVCVPDTNVVPAGSGSDRLTVCAALGPALATVIV